MAIPTDSFLEFAAEQRTEPPVTDRPVQVNPTKTSSTANDWMTMFPEEIAEHRVTQPVVLCAPAHPPVPSNAWLPDVPLNVRVSRWWHGSPWAQRLSESLRNPSKRVVTVAICVWLALSLVSIAATVFLMRDRTPELIAKALQESEVSPVNIQPVSSRDFRTLDSSTLTRTPAAPSGRTATRPDLTPVAGLAPQRPARQPAVRLPPAQEPPTSVRSLPQASAVPVTEPVLSTIAAPLPVPESLPTLPEPRVDVTPPTVATDASVVRSVLEKYRTALSTLSTRQVQVFWPTVNLKALQRAFDQVTSQHVEFSACEIAVRSDWAQASCIGSTKFVPRIGNKTERVQSWNWTFYLAKREGTWVIDSLDSRVE